MSKLGVVIGKVGLYYNLKTKDYFIKESGMITSHTIELLTAKNVQTLAELRENAKIV